jgi:tetratricopeptide (TPR) repeat protein
MKYVYIIFMTLISLNSQVLAASAKKTFVRKTIVKKVMPIAVPKVYTQSTNSNVRGQIQNALTQMKSGQYVQASNNLLALSRRPELSAERSQIKYLLGLTMMELNMNQVASFQFVDVIKSGDGKFTRQALEKLLIVTDKLGDETLLNYAIQRIDVSSVPTQHRDMLFYRMGEIKQKAGQYSEAVQLYSKVASQSRYYLNTLYNMGLSQAEANQTDLALSTFQKLLNSRRAASVTDTNKVAAQMAIARTLYQKKDWEASAEAYAKIPRDHILWHDSVFERSWAMLRAARFRSALSNFQTLHSSYYDNFYIPETLLLRSIVYLYICKYDEMDKVLTLFDKQYGPVEKSIQSFVNTKSSAESYFQELNKAYQIKNDDESEQKTRISYLAIRHVADEGDVRRSFSYIRKLLEEKRQIDSNPQIKSSSIGAYSTKLLLNRIRSAKATTGDMVKAHLENMLVELKDLKEQSGLIRYEMINGKKETLKKRIAGKDLGEVQVDDKRDRSFYVQNGFEYYPFQGEYWLDEVGNYHYLGKQNCE